MGKTETNSSGWRSNKWIRAAIPALLLHCSIGTVYCWSIFSQEIADYIGFSKGATEWAFSFAIFFLGMSAAFLGNVVEKDIHKSSLIATICFASGMALTGFFIYYGGTHQHSMLSLIGIYLSYGFIMGVGLGTGYLSPVKTLMLWFQDRKGLATGLAVAGFGAAKAIASPIMQSMLENLGEGGIYKMFWILACVYFCMMFVGHLLLKKPDGWHEPSNDEDKPSIMSVLKTKPMTNYIGIWLMFYINITCVLALIFIVNAGYGGGFSNVPTLLSDHYGMGSISAIHGITLSAWAFAGLTGNQVATFIINHSREWIEHGTDAAGNVIKVNPVGYQNVLFFTIALYIIALILCIALVRPTDKALEARAAKKKPE